MIKNILLLIFTVIFIACEGPTGPAGKDGIDGEDGINGGNDKEIRLYFNGDFPFTDSNNFVLLPADFYIVKFNKSNYVGVDSIVFMTTLRGYDDTMGAEAKLFNVTDNTDIPNTLLSVSGAEFEWRETANIFASFPNTEITVGIKFRTIDSASIGQIGSPMLILYRK